MSSLPLMPLQSGKIDKAGEEEQGAANSPRLRELCVTSTWVLMSCQSLSFEVWSSSFYDWSCVSLIASSCSLFRLLTHC